MFQPFRVGGYELDPTIYMDVCAEIAKACASSSWVLSNLAIHHHFMALWTEQAQDDVWSASPDTLIGSSYIFTAGRAGRVDGGWRISGRWPFSSGIDPCEWVVVGAMTPTEREGATERHYFLLPRADYEIIDTWHVVGLRGTGSKDIEIRDAFVPAHRVLSFADATSGKAPGLAVNTGPLFRMSMQATGGLDVDGDAVRFGARRGRRLCRRHSCQNRPVTGDRPEHADFGADADRGSRSSARCGRDDPARKLEQGVARAAWKVASSIAQRVMQLKRDAAWCARLCVDAVDTVFAGSGGGGLFEGSAVQRHWRDVHAAAAQFGLQWDVWAPAYGRVRLGLASGMPGVGG